MSEQMTSRDIEDVLVSIRRLVSEDLRPASREVDPADTGKLLLTPALRVIPEPAGARPVFASEPPKPVEARVDLLVAALGRAVRDRAPDWESETGDPSPLRLESPMLPPARPPAPHHGGRLRLGVALSSVEEEADEIAGPDAFPDTETLLGDADVVAFRHEGPGWAQIEPSPATSELAQDAVEIPSPETIEPGNRDSSWSDAAEAAALAELEGASRPEPVQAPDYEGMPEAGGTAALDEAMLREIVREVLREELAGPLGERITRNIRKLVHQEIARALALRNID